ncbi:hypothetical protein BGX38DRAFT_1265740 [Terfezia claveryi]|nr:hypothetical protein BGX38DRAFT_1265740 [Terfezia claveryi]
MHTSHVFSFVRQLQTRASPEPRYSHTRHITTTTFPGFPCRRSSATRKDLQPKNIPWWYRTLVHRTREREQARKSDGTGRVGFIRGWVAAEEEEEEEVYLELSALEVGPHAEDLIVARGLETLLCSKRRWARGSAMERRNIRERFEILARLDISGDLDVR